MATPEQILQMLSLLNRRELPGMVEAQRNIMTEATVCHEAGHALVGLHEGLSIRYAVVFIPRFLNRESISKGITHCSFRHNDVSRSSGIARQRNSLAGLAAEIVHYNLCETAHFDATKQALIMHAYLGSSADLYEAFENEIGSEQAQLLVTPDGLNQHAELLAQRISDCTLIIERNREPFEAIRSAIARYCFVPGIWIRRLRINHADAAV